MSNSTARPFAAFDIDGTLIRWQLYHAVADALANRGYLDVGIYEEIRNARQLWKQRTEDESFKQYEKRLITAYEQLLQDLTCEQFDAAADDVFDEYKDQVYSYTRQLIRDLKAKDYILFAISGSQSEIVGKVAEYYGFDDYIGTSYVRRDGRFTGEAVIHNNVKHIILDELAQKHGATFAGSLAIGDSEGDVSMLAAVEKPIAFNPSKKLFLVAQEKGWPIVLERKNMIYELQHQKNGYILT